MKMSKLSGKNALNKVLACILLVGVLNQVAGKKSDIDVCLLQDVNSNEQSIRTCEDAITESGKKAFKYLQKKLEENRAEFMPGERAAGLLGLLTGSKAYESKKKNDRLLQGKGGILYSNSVAIDFLTRINEIKEEHDGVSQPLEYLDNTSLIQYMGITRAYCLDPKRYYGFDLYHEVERRLKTRNDALDGGLILALCNTNYPVENEIVDNFLNSSTLEPVSSRLYVPEISLKLLATLCMEKKLGKEVIDMSNEEHVKATGNSRGHFQQLTTELSNKLQEYFRETGGSFGKYFQTALATQPLNSISAMTRLYFHSIPALVHMQNEDGSFGDSVPLTALALPAITHITPSDLNDIHCPAPSTNDSVLTLSYVIQDKVLTDQRTTGHIFVSKGTKFISNLKQHTRQNHHTFDLVVDEGGILTRIVSWNDVRNRENLQAYWQVEKDIGNGKLKDITEKLDREVLFKDTRYIISFVTKR